MAAGRLVLGSASPRRADLLAKAGLEFEVLPAHVGEDFEHREDAEDVAVELALRKAEAVAELVAGGPAWVLGGDTVVVLGAGTYLGKPGDEAEAHAMLSSLSGTTHRVVTGVAALRLGPDGAVQASAAQAEVTSVTMRPIEPTEVAAYVASGEWRGKAGGYAIQETADRFVTELAGGGFDNVVGLPVGLTLELLKQVDWAG
ncbi:MAG: Maf family protein [Planctomycetota bacterium]|nr:Maf family protein [Planctomycetota bacterium]